MSIETATAKFDLTLTLTESPKGLSGAVLYNTDLFDASTIDRLVAHFTTLLQGALRDPQRPVSELPILPDRRSASSSSSGTTPGRLSLRRLPPPALRGAGRCSRPDAPAVSFEGETLSYRASDRAANQLARYLKKQGVGAETLVGMWSSAPSTWPWPCSASSRPEAPTSLSTPPIRASASPS
jgi:non-ribosomal peptide synthetase component F